MKNKRYIYIALIGALSFSVGSCSEEYLNVPNDGKQTETNYYKNESEAFSGLVSIYDVLRKNTGSFDNILTFMNAGSDDHFAGGGGETDGVGIHKFENFTIDQFTIHRSYWSDHYQGIFRANILLQKLPNVPMADTTKEQFAAEAKTLRAIYYFNLVRMFKNVPLILEPIDPAAMYDILQAPSEEVYAQMEKDLEEAIPNLPLNASAQYPGRLSQGAARAVLGKIYLYNGKKAEAAAQLALVNGTPGGTSQYGYKLLDSFDDLWVTDNKFNSESILECSHTNLSNAGWGNWGSGTDEGNTTGVMVGPRGYTKIGANAPDLPTGWSFNNWTQGFYDAIKGDPRFEATVLDLKALKAAGQADYTPGYRDTGYFLNKFVPTNDDVTDGAGDAVLNYRQNSYIIRLADTYLMEAEALGATGARAQALLDAVRKRVGLLPVPVTMDAIKKERRIELAGEGHRFFDLVRWGDAASVLASKGFVAGKNEILPIPYQELQGTKIEQNPNYKD
ncbi:RagB/SusD family nutrient uptake outer membrane protein [Chryseobacterium sp. A301]